MTYTLMTCEAQSAVILVSDEPLYALGPVLVADDVAEAYEAMAAFCDALGQPPDQVPTIALMTEWQAFLAAVSGKVLAPLEAVSTGTDDALVALAHDQVTEAASDPDNAPGGAEDYDRPTDAVPSTSTGTDAPPADAATAGSGPAPGEAPPAPAPSSDPAPAIGGDPPEDEDTDQDDEVDIADRIAAARHTPAKDGYVDCWGNCDAGYVEINGERVKCAVCRGEGRIPAPADQPA